MKALKVLALTFILSLSMTKCVEDLSMNSNWIKIVDKIGENVIIRTNSPFERLYVTQTQNGLNIVKNKNYKLIMSKGAWRLKLMNKLEQLLDIPGDKQYTFIDRYYIYDVNLLGQETKVDEYVFSNEDKELKKLVNPGYDTNNLKIDFYESFNELPKLPDAKRNLVIEKYLKDAKINTSLQNVDNLLAKLFNSLNIPADQLNFKILVIFHCIDGYNLTGFFHAAYYLRFINPKASFNELMQVHLKTKTEIQQQANWENKTRKSAQDDYDKTLPKEIKKMNDQMQGLTLVYMKYLQSKPKKLLK